MLLCGYETGADSMTTGLPYVFDLFFDIKTRSQPVTELAHLQDRLASITDLMAQHNIEIDPEEIDRAR